MNTILIIAICLGASTLIQAVGFYAYSYIYKKRFYRSYNEAETAAKIYSLPAHGQAQGNLNKFSQKDKSLFSASKTKQTSFKSINDGPKANGAKPAEKVKSHSHASKVENTF